MRLNKKLTKKINILKVKTKSILAKSIFNYQRTRLTLSKPELLKANIKKIVNTIKNKGWERIIKEAQKTFKTPKVKKASIAIAALLILNLALFAAVKNSKQEIKLSPAPRSSGYLYQRDSKGFAVYLGNRDDKGIPAVGFTSGESVVNFGLSGNISQKVKFERIDDKTIIYRDIQPNIDLIYTLTKNGVKEEIKLKNPEALVYLNGVLNFTVELSQAVPQKDLMGNILPTFIDPVTNEYRFHFEKPYMIDATGNKSYDISLSLEQKEDLVNTIDSPVKNNNINHYQAEFKPNLNWLKTAVYPVVIDPTVTHDSSSHFTGALNRLENNGISNFSTTWTSTSDFNGVGTSFSEGILDPATNDELKLGPGSSGTDKCSGGTATANSEHSAASNAFDNSESTIWQTQGVAYPHWIKYDFGSGVSWAIEKVRVKQYTVNFTGKDYTIAGSNNDSDWSTLDTGTMTNDTDWHDYEFSNSTAYRYIRIYWSNAWNPGEYYQRVAEIEMMIADYATGEQTWESDTQDAGSGNTYKPTNLNANWTLDGSDNIAPKFQILGSSTGSFSGEETIYPNGSGTYYQDGGSYDINNGSDKDITSEVTSSFRYWKVKAFMNTGSTTTDTPIISDITLEETPPSIELAEAEIAKDYHTVGLWHFNETEENSCSGGQDACDSSDNGFHGTASGTTITTSSQKLGDAARSFNGSSDYIEISHNSKQLLNKGGTISAWIYPEGYGGGGYGRVIDKSTGGAGAGGFTLNLTSGSQAIQFFIAGTPGITSSAGTIQLNTWYFITATWDSSGYSNLYINGELAISGAINNPSGITTTNAMRIGNWSTGTDRAFDGIIDEVMLSNSAKSPEEIKAMAQKRPYGVYTSQSIDLGTSVASLDSLEWTDSITGPTAPSGWAKVKPVIIDNSQNSESLTNYQVKLEVPYNSDMQSDFDDLRFTNSSGTNLDYWIEEKTDGVEATIWIEVDSISASSKTTIFMFYDNDGASAGSNGSNTFVGFDDFSNDLSNWSKRGGSCSDTPTISSGQLTIDCDGAGDFHYGYTASPFSDSTARSDEWIVEANVYTDSDSGTLGDNALLILSSTDGGDGNYGYKFYFTGMRANSDNGFIYERSGSSWTLLDTSTWTPTTDDWYKLKTTVTSSEITNYVMDKEDNIKTTTSTTDTTLTAGVFGFRLWEQNVIMDDFKVRKYTDIEPTASLGADIEFETRTSSNGSTWEAWKPTTNETAIDSMDSSNGWSIEGSSVYSNIALSTAPDSTIKIEGSNSIKVNNDFALYDSNTIGLWHLDETAVGTGSTAYDSSGNNNHLVDTGTSGTTLAQGVYGKARGGDENTVLGITSSLYDLGQPLTVCSWIYPTGWGGTTEDDTFRIIKIGSVQFFLDNDGTSNDDTLRLMINTTGTTMKISAVSNLITLNEWQHVCMTWTGVIGTATSQVKFYHNGIESPSYGQTQNGTQTPENTSGYLRILTEGTTGTLQDEVWVSDVIRTDEEIAEAYRAGRNHYMTKTISSTDLSSKNKISFYTAADRPGTYLETYIGENDHSVYGTDSNTKGLWHFDETKGKNVVAIWVANGGDNGGGGAGGFDGELVVNGATTIPRSDDDSSYSTKDANCSANQRWKYYACSHPCTPPNDANGRAWYETNYDDSGWSEGYGPFGGVTFACTGGMLTTSPDDAFFRKDFYTPETISSATLYSGYDDGAQGYINGIQVFNKITEAHGVGYWNDTSTVTNYLGGKIKDVSSNNNHGVVVGANHLQGKIGRGQYFDGTNDFIEIDDNDSLDFTTDFTLEAWVYRYTNSASEERIISKSETDGYDYWLQIESGGTVTCGLRKSDSNNYYITSSSNIDVKTDEWLHLACAFNSTSGYSLYINGADDNGTPTGTIGSARTSTRDLQIGRLGSSSTWYYNFNGIIDEVRVSNSKRTADEIRQAYQYGLRTHPITVDYVTTSGSDGPTSTSDYSFTPDSVDGLYVGDTVIIREAPGDGTTYIMQGEVISISSGEVTVSSWSGTAPSGGYTTNADVFKWQREYWDITDISPNDRNAITKLGLRVLDGSQGFNVYLDDIKSNSNYMTNPTGSTIASTPQRYFQYRAILTTNDTLGTPSLTSVTLNYTTNNPPSPPTGLQTENLTNPTDVTDTTPEFSAGYNDDDSGDIANKYRIQVDDDSGFGSPIWDSGSSGTGMSNCTEGNRCSDISYAGDSLSEGATYYWRIKFWDDEPSEGEWSTETAYFKLNSSPTAPTSLQTEGLVNPTEVTDTTPEFSAIYNDPDSGDIADKYQIQVDDDPGFGSTLWDSGGSGTGMSNCTEGNRCSEISYGGGATDLQYGTTYYWRIKFWDNGGNQGAWSSETAYFTMTPIYTPTSCMIDDSGQNDSLIVKWNDNTTLETGYRVERSVDGAAYSLLTTESTNTTSSTDNTTSDDHTYKYRIRAESDQGNSQWCSTETVDYGKGSFNLKGSSFKGLIID